MNKVILSGKQINDINYKVKQISIRIIITKLIHLKSGV